MTLIESVLFNFTPAVTRLQIYKKINLSYFAIYNYEQTLKATSFCIYDGDIQR